MNPLTKILEEAKALQHRSGVTRREALALALANQRPGGRAHPRTDDADAPLPMQIPLPAASRLDAMLPRDREPTIEEIREAWKECMEQASLFGGAEHLQDLVRSHGDPPAGEK